MPRYCPRRRINNPKVPKSSINVLHPSWICLKTSVMQISKLSVAICATFVGVLPLAVHAADSEAQAKAREALEKAMSQPATQTTPTPSAPVQPQQPAPAPAPAAAPAAVQPAAQPVPAAPAATTTSTPSVRMLNAPSPMSPDDTDKVRAALRQKMAEQQNQPVAVAVTPPPTKPVTPTQPKPGTTVNPPPPHVVYVPSPPPTQPALAPTKVVAPPLPISATKEAQLQELLIRYKADQISPEDYHKERAKILAGP
jgi:hypothetical protein